MINQAIVKGLIKKKSTVRGHIRLQNLAYPFQLLIKVHIKRSNQFWKKDPSPMVNL